MNISLIGYGKMGKAIEALLPTRNHTCVAKLNAADLTGAESLNNAQVAIEFTQPEAAYNNIKLCLENNIPVVIGTTGWYDKFDELKKICIENNGRMFHATNFSVGVNLFFELNKKLAKLMSNQLEYAVEIEEIHHTQKLDSPSGTAITIAEGVLENVSDKKQWVNEDSANPDDLSIISVREPEVPGTHVVTYTSEIDEIEIKHTAFSRQGFALGAIVAAEFLADAKPGIYTMQDLLNL